MVNRFDTKLFMPYDEFLWDKEINVFWDTNASLSLSVLVSSVHIGRNLAIKVFVLTQKYIKEALIHNYLELDA